MPEVPATTSAITPPTLPRSLGDDLILRRATTADAEKLIAFNRAIFDEVSGCEVAFLLSGNYPGFTPEDFLVVVDKDERIVSCLCLVEVKWRLGETEIRLGQPEYVGTLAEYRGRGLIRAQFAVLDRWMAERGLAFSVIGGIHYYYRIFGYEYAVDIPNAGALNPPEHAAQFPPPPGFTVRPRVESDIPAMTRLSAENAALFDLSSTTSPPAWAKFYFDYQIENSEVSYWVVVANDEIVGSGMIWQKEGKGRLFHLTGSFEARQALVAHALRLPEIKLLIVRTPPGSPLARLIARAQPRPVHIQHYGWYIRINDVAAAFRQLAGEFERRLASSPFAGLTRDLELGFYRSGIQLVFQDGKITAVNPLPGNQDPKIGIPPDLIPKLLCGYRDVDQLADIWPDFSADDDWELLRVLFPRLSNCVLFFL